MSVAKNVFSIKGREHRGHTRPPRRTLVTAKVGDEIEIIGLDQGATRRRSSPASKCSNKTLDKRRIAGDNVGLLYSAASSEQIERGQVIAKPGSMRPHTKVEGQDLRSLTKEEGGRAHPVLQRATNRSFYFRTTDVTRQRHRARPMAVEMCMPGDNVKVTVEVAAGNADRHGRRVAVRHPAGEPGLRLRRRDEDSDITPAGGSVGNRSFSQGFSGRWHSPARKYRNWFHAPMYGWNARETLHPQLPDPQRDPRRAPAGTEKYCRKERKHTPHKESRKK